MYLSPITNRKESRLAFNALRTCLMAGAKRFKRTVGWPSNHGEFTLYWHEDAEFWVVFSFAGLSRFWCAYGTMDPRFHRSVDITCEINPPTEGIDRRCGGIFLKDSGNGLYLAHSRKSWWRPKGHREDEVLRGVQRQPSGSRMVRRRHGGTRAVGKDRR